MHLDCLFYDSYIYVTLAPLVHMHNNNNKVEVPSFYLYVYHKVNLISFPVSQK